MSEHSQNRRRKSHSFFSPIVMIAIGVYFLLFNLGIVEMPNWWMIFQLWPLWLILLGINIIVQQVPRPFGGFLSGMVGLTAVLLLGYLLFFGDDSSLLARLRPAPTVEAISEEVSFTPNDVSAATIEIDLNSAGAKLFALEDSNELIAGTVSYRGDLIFETDESGNEASIFLDTTGGSNGFFWLNPSNWEESSLETWELGLNPSKEISLRLDGSSGATDADLDALSLSYLYVDAGSGGMNFELPNGDYEVEYNAGSGATRIVFPANGRLDVNFDGASGSVSLTIPDSMEAQIEVNDGSGSFLVNGRFEQIEGNDNEDGTWQTENYDDATNRINLTLDIGSGSVRIATP